ncbi:aminodeoxychorismate synthase component I [Salinicola aestuarinus]|uniref:aminodeoxychorismate synthase component I n=1 Tax=Salinicola aestuarinus TaxID=1949082 RepID=UPI000DA164B6|nr:aminodeoxychorismate synthase component I [Salinicola aestuarinus]
MADRLPPLGVVTVPYSPDPSPYFTVLRHRPDAILLDSGRPKAPGGRFDILSSDPIYTLSQEAGQLRCSPSLPGLPNAPFEAQRYLLDHCINHHLPLLEASLAERYRALPFFGGLMGQWGYTLAQAHRQGAPDSRPGGTLPVLRLGVYDWALIQDHETQRSYLIASAERREAVLSWLKTPPTETDSSAFALTTAFTPDMDRNSYGERFRRVQAYLQAGDCYQINLAQRFTAGYRGDLWQAYRQLREATPTPYAGYLATDGGGTLSLSPERFVRAIDGQIETRPIKGTRARGNTPSEDRRLAEALQTSAKDRAENIMIVDLLRNDLGRVCRPGSVEVPQLCGLESYANVHHLVSVIRGELEDGVDPLDLLAAAFPGGSITGAPKHRAMQIIDELEPSQRSVYCGSLGYVDRRGRMDTSIAIRTVVAQAQTLHIWGGGGLVADSQEQEEYDETLAKITRLMTALGGG